MRDLRLYLKYKLFLVHKIWTTIKLVPVVQICLGLILGMVLADLLSTLIVSLLGLVLVLLGKKRLVLLSLAFLVGVGWYFVWFNPERVEQIQSFVGQTLTLQATVVQDPVVSGNWQRLVVSSPELPGLVQLEVPTYPNLVIGDRLQTTAKLEGASDLEGGYANYLVSQEIFYIARSREFEVIEIDSNPLFLVGRWKTGFVARVASLLDPPVSQVVLGLLIGGQGEFPSDLKQQFVETGITHIFSVSGYNVGIVMLGFLSLAGVINRRLLVKLAMVGLLLFGIAVGPGNPAAVRAVIMGELVLVSLWLGKTKILPLMLLYAVNIMLLIYPLAWRNVSMQLSVAAMVGILFLRQAWEQHLRFMPEVMRETIVVTMAVTVATMPVSLATFGGLSLIALLTNLLVLPMLPLIMAAGGLGVLFSYLIPTVSSFLLWFVSLLVNLVIQIVSLLASVPGGYSEDVATNWVIFGLVVVVFLFLDYRLVINRYALSCQRES